MRKLIFFLLLVNSTLIFTQEVGFVNVDRIFRDFSAMQDIRTQLQQIEDTWRREAETKKSEWLNSKQELEDEEVVLSEEEIARRTRVIEQRREDYESFVQQVWGENGLLEVKTEELSSSAVIQINKIIQEIAEVEKFNIILNSSSALVLYAIPGIDITDNVLSRLNAEYSSIIDTLTITKTKTVVLSVIPITADAKTSGIGAVASSYIMKAFSNIVKLEIIEQSDVSDALSQIGISSQENITESQLASLAAFLEAEYIVRGWISQDQDQFVLEISVFSASLYGDIIEVEHRFDGEDNLERAVELLTSDIMSSI